MKNIKEILEAGKIPHWCPKCNTIFLLLPYQSKQCIDGTELKELNELEYRQKILLNEISSLMKISSEVAEKLVKDIKEDIKNNLHIVIGIYGGVLQDTEIFIEDDKATEYEKKLCNEYEVPFDKEERQNYYDSDGEHAIHHLIVKLQ